MADQEEFLPDGWIKSFSKRFNKHYYFNSQTNESIWENPFQNNNEVHTFPLNFFFNLFKFVFGLSGLFANM